MADPLQQARALFGEGNAHFQAGRFDAARVSLEAALALAPGRPSIQANLGLTLFGLRDWAAAVPHLEASTTAEPGQPDAWLALGLAREALGLWPVAAQALEQALAQGVRSADAWLALGRCRGRMDDGAAALQAFEQALALDGSLAEAWSARGGLLRDARRFDEAAACYERALQLGADEALHSFYLASVRAQAAPPAAPPRAYVEALFDQYAGDFDTHLVQGLKYQGHATLLRPLLEPGERFPHALDLGCGTGLCARLLHAQADVLEGVDLSSSMVAQARATGLYRQVVHGDLLDLLQASTTPVDLAVAADVFIYVGALDAVFAAVRRRLRLGGCFAFSVELHAGAGDMVLRPSLRYAHSAAYVDALARRHGFDVLRRWEAPIREDQGVPVRGLYLHLAAGG